MGLVHKSGDSTKFCREAAANFAINGVKKGISRRAIPNSTVGISLYNNFFLIRN